MLVRPTKTSQDFTGTRVADLDKLFIVFAIEYREGGEAYYILPYGFKTSDQEADPIGFPAESFEIVADFVSKNWSIKEIGPVHNIRKTSSFPEWFENDFYIRAHDWNLDDEDYKIMLKYKQQYEQIYKNYNRRKSNN